MQEQVPNLAVDEAVRDTLKALEASTLHRLLGWRPDSSSRFRHHRGNRLPHDVVIVDETSMVSLSLMGRLVEAVRPDARLVLIGDPGQLTSIEAGAVLGDVVGPAADGPLRMREDAAAALRVVTGQAVPCEPPADDIVIGDGTIVLDRVHRFGGAIAALAQAIRDGDADKVVGLLAAGGEGVRWLDVDAAQGGAFEALRAESVKAGGAVLAAARAGDALAALAAMGSFRLLCAHRRGPYGAITWMRNVERWLTAALEGFNPIAGDWYVGRPLLVTENDYSLGLYNGDTGVVVAVGDDEVTAAFERHGEVLPFRPSRLSAVDTVYAMTVHKSQGSQFDTAAVLLPGRRLADPHPRTALHGGDAREQAAHRGRPRAGRARRGRAARGTGERVARAVVGRGVTGGATAREPQFISRSRQPSAARAVAIFITSWSVPPTLVKPWCS